MDNNTFNTFRDIVAFASLVVGAVLILMSKVKTNNLKDLRERVDILEKELVYSRQALEREREQAREQHVANRESIAKLQGQVEIYKDLQLKSIADTNKEILATLKGSASIAADEKEKRRGSGILVKTEQDHPLDGTIK